MVGTLRFMADLIGATAPLITLWLAPDLVRLLIATGDVDGAAAVVRAIEPVVGRCGVASAFGTARLCEGMVLSASADARAVPVLREARAHLQAAQRLPLLLTSLELLARVDRDPALHRAGRELRVALGVTGPSAPFDVHEEAPLVRAAHELVGAQFAFLTATERRVADLIAEGLTNGGIATELGMSKRTVEFHVSHVYVKLGVSTRTGIAALVRNARS